MSLILPSKLVSTDEISNLGRNLFRPRIPHDEQTPVAVEAAALTQPLTGHLGHLATGLCPVGAAVAPGRQVVLGYLAQSQGEVLALGVLCVPRLD